MHCFSRISFQNTNVNVTGQRYLHIYKRSNSIFYKLKKNEFLILMNNDLTMDLTIIQELRVYGIINIIWFIIKIMGMY